MFFKAIVDLPPVLARAREYSKIDGILGRLDSGIELDLGLQSPSRNVNFQEDLLDVKKGDVFKPIKVPNAKRLVYVERVCRDASSNDPVSNDAVFCLDIDRGDITCEASVTRGYVPVDCLEMDGGKIETDIAFGNGCIDCESILEETLKLRAVLRKLSEENKQLKTQLQELKLTNDGLLDSLSWNGDDEPLTPFSVSPGSPKPLLSPRFIRSPRSMRAKLRTSRSESSDPDTDTFLKILEKATDKQQDILEDDMLLSCTLCSRKIKKVHDEDVTAGGRLDVFLVSVNELTELEIHSKVCSSASACKEVTLTVPNMLITTVTQVNHTSSTDQLLKLITKTTLKSYDGHLFEVNRQLEDFLWFRETLQLMNPARIVPAITMHGTVNGNFREIQRFLKRLVGHKALRTHDFVRDFLTQKDISAIRKRIGYRNVRRSNTPVRRPAYQTCDQNSLLYRASVYISKFLRNLEDLSNHFNDKINKSADDNIMSKKFNDLSDGEVNETYLKIAASGLSRITQETITKKEDCHESAIIEELHSLHGNVKEAENLVRRVEAKRDNYLFWNEEMMVYEYQTDDKDKSPSQKAAISQKWAEASANCEAAKTSLENICKSLSEELYEFDITKESELKDILVDFANGQFQYYEKLQSKWHGVRIMLDTDLSPIRRGYDIVNP